MGFANIMVAVGLAWPDEVSEAEDASEAVMPDMSLRKRLEHISANDLRELVFQLADEVQGAYAVVDRWLFGRMLQETPAEAVEGGLDALEAYIDEMFDVDRLGTLSEDALEEWLPSGQRAIEELNSLDDTLDCVVSDLARLPEDAPLTVPGLERICRRVAETEQEFEEISGTWHDTASMAASMLSESTTMWTRVYRCSSACTQSA